MRIHNRTPVALFIAALTLAVPAVVEGGSVFLKNGYILQGKIVERGEGCVVLGWQNGTMTIEDRFIDEVLLDPSEEAALELKRLEEEEARLRANEAVFVESALSLGAAGVVKLPESYGDILGPGRTPVIAVESPAVDLAESRSTDEAVAVDPVVETPVVEVERVTAADFSKNFSPGFGLTMTVPEHWVTHAGEERATVAHPESPTRDFLTIDRWTEGRVDAVVAVETLRRAVVTSVPGCIATPVADRVIGGMSAKSLACSGGETPREVEQYVITSGASVWVIGVHAEASTPPETREALQSMLASISFE